MTRHRELLRVRRAGGRVPDLPRRRAGHRRPGRAQPRHPRRLALPGRPVARTCPRSAPRSNASCVIRGSGGERVVTMEEFHRGPYETAVGDAEMLIEVRIPVRPNGSSAYEKVERRAGDWAVVSAGAAVWMDGDVIADARVGLAAVGPNTTGIPAISEALRGQAAVRGAVRAGRRARRARTAARSPTPRGSAEYKRHLADELTRRALRRAVARIEGRA